MERRISEAREHDKQQERCEEPNAGAFSLLDCRLRDTILQLMKQPHEKVRRLRRMFACASLSACLFVASSFREALVVVEAGSPDRASQLAKSAPIDSAVSSLERQVRIQNKAPRRQ